MSVRRAHNPISLESNQAAFSYPYRLSKLCISAYLMLTGFTLDLTSREI